MDSIQSRNYETEADLLNMQDLLVEGRSLTDDWSYPHLGDLQWLFFMVARHLDLNRHIRVWHAGENLVGYAVVSEDPAFEFQVRRGFEWCGIEEEAILWAEQLIWELRKQNPDPWSGPCSSTARQDNARRIEFLKEHSFQPGGEFSEVNMLRMLDEPVPDAYLPVDCKVQSMHQSPDIPNRAACQREVWHPWTVGNISDEDYAWLMRLPKYDPELDLVTVMPDGVMAAYVNGWIDPVNQIGDLGPVGARPGFRRKGFTRAVLGECLRRMKDRGMNRVIVSTGETNIPAIRLYRVAWV